MTPDPNAPKANRTKTCIGPPIRNAAVAVVALLAASTAPAANADTLKVVTTIKPIHALVGSVMEGVGEPDLLVKGAASPHTYSLKPSDAKALNDAQVFFRVSEHVEPFTIKIAGSLPKSVKVVTLADAPGVEALPMREGGMFEKHVHDHGAHHDDDDDHVGHEKHADGKDHAGHDDAHEKGHEDHDGHEDHEHYDGHVWLDPENAKKMVAEIARVLSEASPENAAKFKANAERLTGELDKLQAEIAKDVAPLKGKPFVVFHDAYQYFERRFGLSAVGSITVSPEVQPSAKRLSEIREKLTKLDAACVFAEPNFQPKLVSAITEGTKAKSGTLDPEGASIEPGNGAYAAMLRNLATNLKSCLAQGS